MFYYIYINIHNSKLHKLTIQNSAYITQKCVLRVFGYKESIDPFVCKPFYNYH